MDDVIVFTPTFAEHLKFVRMAFDRFRSSGITIKASKCQIGFKEIDFLGFKLSEDGIRPQEGLTEAIEKFDRPTNVKELKRFLGLIGFYRNFIASLA